MLVAGNALGESMTDALNEQLSACLDGELPRASSTCC